MKEIHDRMPLILEKDMIHDWINDDSAVMHILHHEPSMLKYELANEINMPLFLNNSTKIKGDNHVYFLSLIAAF